MTKSSFYSEKVRFSRITEMINDAMMTPNTFTKPIMVLPGEELRAIAVGRIGIMDIDNDIVRNSHVVLFQGARPLMEIEDRSMVDPVKNSTLSGYRYWILETPANRSKSAQCLIAELKKYVTFRGISEFTEEDSYK